MVRKRSFLKKVQKKIRKKSSQHLTLKLYRIVQIPAIIVCVIVLVIYIPLFHVNIHITGASSESNKKIQEYVDQERGEYIGIFPAAFIFLIQPGRVKELVEERFPNIGSAIIDRTFPRGLKVVIREREVFASQCHNKTCTFVDPHGFVFGESELTFNTEIVTPTPLIPGTKITFEEEIGEVSFHTIYSIVKQLEQDDFFMERITVNNETSEVFLHPAEEDFYIWIDLKNSLYNTTQALHIIFSEVFITSEERAEIGEYIDVRDPSTVRWKPRGESIKENTVGSSSVENR